MVGLFVIWPSAGFELPEAWLSETADSPGDFLEGGIGPPACALANELAVGASSLDETEAEARDLVLVFVFVFEPAAVLPVLLIPMLPTPKAALVTLAKLPLVPRDDTPAAALDTLLLVPIEDTPEVIELLLVPNREPPVAVPGHEPGIKVLPALEPVLPPANEGRGERIRVTVVEDGLSILPLPLLLRLEVEADAILLRFVAASPALLTEPEAEAETEAEDAAGRASITVFFGTGGAAGLEIGFVVVPPLDDDPAPVPLFHTLLTSDFAADDKKPNFDLGACSFAF